MNPESALHNIRQTVQRKNVTLDELKRQVEAALAEGVQSDKLIEVFGSAQAWRKFRKVVAKKIGPLIEPIGYGIVVGDKMFPIHPDTQDHVFNQAARQGLRDAHRTWGVVWSFREPIFAPAPIGACGLRSHAGFFLAEDNLSGPVIRKYQPHEPS